MQATEPMTTEQVAQSLVMDQSEETETEADEVSEDQTEAEDVETETDDEADASTDDEDETDADDDSDDEADESPAQLHTVKVDGVEKQVPYEELVRGYAGQDYVQKGMTKNAEAAKQYQQQAQTLQSERQAVLQAFEALRSGNIAHPPQPPQIDADQDPIGWMQEQARYQNDLSRYQQQQGSLQQLQAQNDAQQKQAHNAYMQEQRQRAVELIPELGDAEKAPKIMRDLVSAAGAYGFDEAEVKGVMDARALALLNDAARYQALKSSTAKGHKKVEGARPVLKPGATKAANPKAAQKARKNRAIQTQRSEDWAKTLLT